MDCKECKYTCCDDLGIKPDTASKGITKPSECKPGDWFFVKGITLVKKKNGLWRCLAFDPRTRLCRIWRYRPPVCRGFFCSDVKRKKRKLPVNYWDSEDKRYSLFFTPK